jgi:ADP-ribosylation factor protein 6
MGLIFSLLNWLFPDEEFKILTLGVDNAGKSTLLYFIKQNIEALNKYPHLNEKEISVISKVPPLPLTVGFSIESVKYKNIKLNVWDIGGQRAVREVWRHYMVHVNLLLFVIDVMDPSRYNENIEEFYNLLEFNKMELDTIPIIVVFNKIDLILSSAPLKLTTADKNGKPSPPLEQYIEAIKTKVNGFLLLLHNNPRRHLIEGKHMKYINISAKTGLHVPTLLNECKKSLLNEGVEHITNIGGYFNSVNKVKEQIQKSDNIKQTKSISSTVNEALV